jgi:hypothetical protein
VPADSFHAGIDDDDSGFGPGRSGESQYEMTAVLGGDPDDSQTELPAFTSDLDSSDSSVPTRRFEAPTAARFETLTPEPALPMPWVYNVIDSWGRLHFFLALGFAAASLLVLGFLLVWSLIVGQILSSSIAALIVGCVGTIAFLLLSISATALIFLLIDLARNVHRLIHQAGPTVRVPADPKAQNGRSLSHQIG